MQNLDAVIAAEKKLIDYYYVGLNFLDVYFIGSLTLIDC